jgi:NTE family protein
MGRLGRRAARKGDISLVLSGGIALGAYQGGAYAELHEAHGRDLRWLAGSSIGAVNAAIIAGNESDRRVAQLDAFWQAAALPLPDTGPLLQQSPVRQVTNWLMAMHTRAVGRAGIFTPRPPAELLLGGTLSLYDLGPLGGKLEQFIDFRRLNEGDVRLSVVTTDLETGEAVVFDTADRAAGWIEPKHLLASCGFLPELQPIEIDGHLLGDGGLVANAPIEVVLDGDGGDDRDTDEPLTCFLVELFCRRGERPKTLVAAAERRLDLLLAGQTKRALDGLVRESASRQLLAETTRRPSKQGGYAGRPAGFRGALVLHLAYRPVPATAGPQKHFDISPASLADRWTSGAADMQAALSAWRRMAAPKRGELVIHDVGQEAAL